MHFLEIKDIKNILRYENEEVPLLFGMTAFMENLEANGFPCSVM